MGKEKSFKTVIQVKVLPRASSTRIIGKENGVFKIKLTSPPVEGKANKALKELLARRLSLPKRDIEIISGERSRVKLIQILGINQDEANRLLENGR